jgi:hypothetical protein
MICWKYITKVANLFSSEIVFYGVTEAIEHPFCTEWTRTEKMAKIELSTKVYGRGFYLQGAKNVDREHDPSTRLYFLFAS